ncbi:rCG23734, partial [Rattus norvegicus]
MLLFFPETLAILSDTGEPQGELTIEVQKGKYKDDLGILTHCLLVHASSRGFLDKLPQRASGANGAAQSRIHQVSHHPHGEEDERP